MNKNEKDFSLKYKEKIGNCNAVKEQDDKERNGYGSDSHEDEHEDIPSIVEKVTEVENNYYNDQIRPKTNKI